MLTTTGKAVDPRTPLATLREEIQQFIDRNGIGIADDRRDEGMLVEAMEMFMRYEIDRERKKAVEEAFRRIADWMGNELYDFPVPRAEIMNTMFPPKP